MKSHFRALLLFVCLWIPFSARAHGEAAMMVGLSVYCGTAIFLGVFFLIIGRSVRRVLAMLALHAVLTIGGIGIFSLIRGLLSDPTIVDIAGFLLSQILAAIATIFKFRIEKKYIDAALKAFPSDLGEQ